VKPPGGRLGVLQTPARRFHWNKTKSFPFSDVFSFNHL
jgi:hypothetical protein